jgi:hypothetical protein
MLKISLVTKMIWTESKNTKKLNQLYFNFFKKILLKYKNT